MTKKNEPIVSCLPSIEKLTNIGAFPRGFWISIVGHPATGKSILSTIAAYNWLLRSKESCVIFITMEHDKGHILNQAISLSFNLIPFTKNYKLQFVNLSQGKNRNMYKFQESVQQCSSIAKEKFGENTEILLIGDGMASLWEGTASTTGTKWGKMQDACRKYIDLAIMTLKLSQGGKAYGVAAEYLSDVIIRLKKFIQIVDKTFIANRSIYIDKFRYDDHDRTIRSLEIKGKNIIIGHPVNTSSPIYDNMDKAIDGLRYQLGNKIQQERNDILEKLDKNISNMTKLIMSSFKLFQKEIITLKK